MEEVFECLIGPSLVQQLRQVTCKDAPGMEEVIPVLLKQKASGNSLLTITPTNSSAIEAKIDVHISQNRPLQVGGKKVLSAKFIVKQAKTIQPVEITMKVNVDSRFLSLKVSDEMDLTGGCGQTVADHIYCICCKEEAWLHVRKRTVGEILHVFLREEKALLAIKSLPLFLSLPMIKCKINHYLTTVLVDSSQALQEAHVYCPSFVLAPVFINKRKLHIQIKSLAMHLFPTRDVDQHMIKIEGDCVLNKVIPMKFTCSSTSDLQKHVKFFFANTQPAKKVFDLFGVSHSPASLMDPISGNSLSDKISYECGFVLSQLLASTEESAFTSFFFGVEFCSNIEHLLPPVLNHIKYAKVETVVHFPSAKTPMLGLEASFTSELEVSDSPELRSVMLECCLSVCPSIKDGDYTYKLTIRQQYEAPEFQGMPVYAIISALSGTLGRNMTEKIKNIPEVGDQILNKVSLRKMVLQIQNREIQALELHVTMSELDIIPGKLSASNCTLKMSYTKENFMLECNGNLVFLRRYKYSVDFSLPTAENEGEISFQNHDSGLVFKDLMQEFGWLSHDVRSNSILSEVLDIVIRRVAMNFHFTPGDDRLQITAASFSVFKEQLDIGLLTIHGIELDVSTKLVKGRFITSFSLAAYISDALHARLEYNPDSHVMTGEVRVTFSKSVSAVDVLQLFQTSANSYKNMKSILQDEFMDVFNSDLKVMTQPGLTTSLSISISLPSEHSKLYSLEHLKLEVEDVLKICCIKNSYVLNTFQFEYFNKPQSKDVASTSHLSLTVHRLNSKENMTLDFDLTSRKDSSSFLTAKVEVGPQGGFLKLSSAIDLAWAAIPELPKFDVGLPPIFDIELLSGSISFNLEPSFKPAAFDLNILIQEWQIFNDPKLKVHKVILKTSWESGSSPQLTFTDCSLTFLEHKLNLSGRLTSEEVYIECSSAEKLPESTPTHFQTILRDCTPQSLPQPVLPTNIGLPPMMVEIKEFIVQLKEINKKFRVNTRVIAHSPWMIKFGSHVIPVYELGGALEWEKVESKTEYKAFLYGTVELFGMQVGMEMLLGKNIDSIVSAAILHPQCLCYGQVADNLLCSEEIVPYEQYNPKDSGLFELVPSSMQDISLNSASTALNVTKKQFFQQQSAGMGYWVSSRRLPRRQM